MGFTAVLDHNVTADVNTATTVVFNHLVGTTAATIGYDSSTGIFTAPVDGLYVFHVHAYSAANDSVQYILYLEC